MATSLINKSQKVADVLGNLAAAQTIAEKFPASITFSGEKLDVSLDPFYFLNTILKKILKGQTLQELLLKIMSEKLGDNDYWLQTIEESIKLIIETNITNILTCQMSPLVPDSLIGERVNYKLANIRTQVENGMGLLIPASFIDMSNTLSQNPFSETGRNYYMTCKDDDGNDITMNNLWMHDDFNAFLYYVKTRGTWGDDASKNKLTWDNRYKSKPYQKYKRKTKKFFTQNGDGKTPFTYDYLKTYNSDEANHKEDGIKRQILEVRYINETYPLTDSYYVTLPASNYYRTRSLISKVCTKNKIGTKITKAFQNKVMINKTIFEFNHEFLMSVKLLDAKTIINSIICNLTGVGNFSLNFSVEKDAAVADELINATINKTIEDLETEELDDSYYTFSNEEYDEAIKLAAYKAKNGGVSSSVAAAIDSLGNITSSTNKVEQKTEIETLISSLVSETVTTSATTSGGTGTWKFKYDVKFELVRMFVYPFIRPLISPKVLMLLYVNLSIMGDPFNFKHSVYNTSGATGTIEDIKNTSFVKVAKYIYPIMKDVIKLITNILIELLYREIVSQLYSILESYALKVLAERLKYYKDLIDSILKTCGAGLNGLINSLSSIGVKTSAIDNVTYADIDESIEKIKYKPTVK